MICIKQNYSLRALSSADISALNQELYACLGGKVVTIGTASRFGEIVLWYHPPRCEGVSIRMDVDEILYSIQSPFIRGRACIILGRNLKDRGFDLFLEVE